MYARGVVVVGSWGIGKRSWFTGAVPLEKSPGERLSGRDSGWGGLVVVRGLGIIGGLEETNGSGLGVLLWGVWVVKDAVPRSRVGKKGVGCGGWTFLGLWEPWLVLS